MKYAGNVLKNLALFFLIKVIEMLEGLKSAIEAREHKAKTTFLITRLDNARAHYVIAIEELKKGFAEIKQFDEGL